MPNIIFTKDANSFVFERGRYLPVSGEDGSQVNVVVDYSEGGQLYAYDKGINETYHALNFNNVTQADYDNYDNWFKNVAVGAKNPFTFTDEDGISRTVRIIDSKNMLKRNAHQADGKFAYSGVVTLREEI
jgi:hypothetical protein